MRSGAVVQKQSSRLLPDGGGVRAFRCAHPAPDFQSCGSYRGCRLRLVSPRKSSERWFGLKETSMRRLKTGDQALEHCQTGRPSTPHVRAATAAAPPLRAVAAPRPRRRRAAGPRDRALIRSGPGRVGRERDHHAGRRALLDARGRPHEAHVLLTLFPPPRVLRHSLLTSPSPRERLVIS